MVALQGIINNNSKIISTKSINKKTPFFVDNFTYSDYSVNGSNTPTAFEQSSDCPYGNQSLRVQSSGARAEVYRTLSTTQDFSSCIFKMSFKTSSFDNFIGGDGCEIGFRDTLGNLKYFQLNKISGYQEQDNEWITLCFSTYTIASGVQWNTINRLYLRSQASSGLVVDNYFANLEVYKNTSTGKITIGNDDGRIGAMLQFKAMGERGIPGYMSLIEEYTKPGVYTGYMKDNDIIEAGRNGIEAVLHDSYIYNLTDDERKARIKKYIKWINKAGFLLLPHYISPNGFRNAQFEADLKEAGILSLRTTSDIGQSEDIFNPYAINCFSVQNIHTVADVKTRIDDAINNGEWINLVFHDIIETGSPTTGQYLLSDLEEILDYIIENYNEQVTNYTSLIN